MIKESVNVNMDYKGRLLLPIGIRRKLHPDCVFIGVDEFRGKPYLFIPYREEKQYCNLQNIKLNQGRINLTSLGLDKRIGVIPQSKVVTVDNEEKGIIEIWNPQTINALLKSYEPFFKKLGRKIGI